MPSLRRLALLGCSLALLGGALAMLEKTDEPRPIFVRLGKGELQARLTVFSRPSPSAPGHR
jgi:hypothetical protein